MFLSEPLAALKRHCRRRDVRPGLRRYGMEALSCMVRGLFASLIAGLMLRTFGDLCQLELLKETGTTAMRLMGPAVGVAVAWGLGAPPLVLFASVVTGATGAAAGGPAGAFLAALAGTECGKLVAGCCRVDIIVTPLVTVLTGSLAALLIGPLIRELLSGIGALIQTGAHLQPAVAGALVAALIGMAMCTPLSSTAIAIMLDLHGVVAGAATVGCCCQLVGFAIAGYRDNGPGGLVSMGLGCAMLQAPNIMKNPWIWLPPILSSLLLGPWVTTLFPMSNLPEGAGMGSSGLVGQIGAVAVMGANTRTFALIAAFHFLLPGLLCGVFAAILRRMGKIRDGDMAVR